MVERDGIDEMVQKLEQFGIAFNSIPQITEEGVSRFTAPQDSEGNLHQSSQKIK